jgi:branched-chain amino acid transport system permease protein
MRRALLPLVVLLLLVLLPLPIPDVYLRDVMILTLLYAGLASAWNVLGGYCGQISLGHAVYFGIGAYVSTMLYLAGVPPWIGFLPAALAGAAAGLLVGWPCFRLSGHYYAVATVVVGEIVYLLALNWNFVGAATGLTIPFTGPDSWLWLQFRTAKLPYYYLLLGYAVLCWGVSRAVMGSRWGFAWRAVKDDSVAARSLGVSIFTSKMAAAAISGALTALGGAIYARYVGYIDPDSTLAGTLSILIPLPAVLGGVGSLWGPMIGAAILIPVSELSRSYLGGSGSGIDLMIYGGLIVLVALLRPQGLASIGASLGIRRRHGAA